MSARVKNLVRVVRRTSRLRSRATFARIGVIERRSLAGSPMMCHPERGGRRGDRQVEGPLIGSDSCQYSGPSTSAWSPGGGQACAQDDTVSILVRTWHRVFAQLLFCFVLLTTFASAQVPWNKVQAPPLPAFQPQQPTRVQLPNGMVIFLQPDHELPLDHGNGAHSRRLGVRAGQQNRAG